MKLILASASPRRAAVLRDAGFRFDTLPTETDETPLAGEAAAAMVRRLAEAKARAALARLRQAQPPASVGAAEPAIVLAADTTVELEGAILGKPGSPSEARAMLARLSGKTHFVHTGVALVRLPDEVARSGVETTAVRFTPLSAEEIETYVASGDPLDKAGGYGIQSFAGRFVERIEGCYFNVVGLPLSRVYRLLRELGWYAGR